MEKIIYPTMDALSYARLYAVKKALLKFTDLIVQIEAYQAANQQLVSLRDFLLPMLMNGQISVQISGRRFLSKRNPA